MEQVKKYEWSTFSNDLKSGYRVGNLMTILSSNIELRMLPPIPVLDTNSLFILTPTKMNYWPIFNLIKSWRLA